MFSISRLGTPCDFSTAWKKIHGILNFKRFCIIWSKLAFSCSLQRHWKRQPLFPSLHLPLPLWADRGAFNESRPCTRRVLSCVFPSSSGVSDGSDREDTCPEPRRWQRAREGGEEVEGRKEQCLMGEAHNKATNLERLSLIVTGQEVPRY